MKNKGVGYTNRTRPYSTSGVSDTSRSHPKNDTQSVTKQIPANSPAGVPDKTIQERKPLVLQRNEQLRAALRSWQIYSPPSHIPSEVSAAATKNAEAFKRGVEKVVSTGVPGTETLQFSTAHSVIKTPKGYIHVPYGKRLAPGFHVTDQGHRVHSSTIAVDAPFLSCASSFEDQIWVNSFCNRQQPAPDGTWLHSQLSSDSHSPPLLERRQSSLLNRTAAIKDNYDLPEQHLRHVQDRVHEHQEQLERIDRQSQHLQTAVRELTTETTELAALLKTHSESANMSSAEAVRVAHDTHTIPKADSVEHKRLQERLSELEATLEESLIANGDLKETQKNLHTELLRKQQNTLQLTQEIDELKAHKEELEAQFHRLTEETRSSTLEIDKLQKERELLADHIEKQASLLENQQEELRAIHSLLTAAKEASTHCHTQIVDLRQQVTHLTTKEKETTRQLHTVQQQLHSSEEKTTQAEATLKAANDKLVVALKKIQDLQVATNTRRLESEKWEQQWKLERQNAQQMLEEQQKHIAELENRHNFALDLNKTLAEQNRKTKETLEGSREQLQATSEELKTVNTALKKLNSEHHKLCTQSQEQASAISTLQNTNFALQEKLTRTSATVDQFQQKNAALLKAVQQNDQSAPQDSLEAAVTHVLSKNVELTTQLNQGEIQYSEAVFNQQKQKYEIATLQSNLRDHQTILSGVTEKLKATEKNLQEKAGEVKIATKLLRDTKTELQKQRNNNNAVKEQNSALSDRISNLESSDFTKDKELQQLRSQLATAHEQNRTFAQNSQELQKQLDQEKAANASNTQTIESLKSELAGKAKQSLELQRDLSLLHKHVQASEADWVRATLKMEHHQQELMKAEVRHQALQANILGQNIQLKAKDAEIERLQKIADSTNELSQENTELLKRITVIEKNRTELTEVIEKTTRSYRVADEKAKDLDSKVQTLTEELNAAQTQITKVEQEKEALNQEIKTLNQEKEQLKLQANDEKESRRRIREELKNSEYQLTQKNQEIEKTQVRISALEGHLKHAQKEIESLRSIFEDQFVSDNHQSSTEGKIRPETHIAGLVFDKHEEYETKIKNLQTQLVAASKAIEKKKNEVIQKDLELANLQANQTSLIGEKDNVSYELQKARSEINDQVEQARDLSKKLVAECEKTKKLENDSKLQIAQWNIERQHLDTQLNQRLSEIDALTREKNKLTMDHLDLENQYSALQTKSDEAIIQTKNELVALRVLNTELESTAKKWEILSEEKEENLKTLHKEHDAALKELKDMQVNRDLQAQELEKLNQEYRETTQAVSNIEKSIIDQIKDVTDDFESQKFDDSLPSPERVVAIPLHMTSSISLITQELHNLTKRWREKNNNQMRLKTQLAQLQFEVDQADQKITQEQMKYANLEESSSLALKYESGEKVRAQNETQELYTRFRDKEAELKKLTETTLWQQGQIEKLDKKLKAIPSEPTPNTNGDMISTDEYTKTVEEMKTFCEGMRQKHQQELETIKQQLENEIALRRDAETYGNTAKDEKLALQQKINHEKGLLQKLLDHTHSSLTHIQALKNQLEEFNPEPGVHAVLAPLLKELEQKLMEGDLGWEMRLEEFAQEGVTPSHVDEKTAADNAFSLLSMLLPQKAPLSNTSSRKSSISSNGDSGISSDNNGSSSDEVFETKDGNGDDKDRAPSPSTIMKITKPARRQPLTKKPGLPLPTYIYQTM